VRRPEEILYQGVGAREPRADNTTEAGREANRRVEILILDN
jgi:outer membrane protein OmpA-like peptidoglycan-associated protein